MADAQTKKTVAVNAAKIGGITAVVPLLFSAIPEPWSTVVASVVFVCAGIAAAVPAPPVGSKWTLPYKLVSLIGINIGWAANHIGARVNASQGPVAQTAIISQDKK
ncbi:hypothetical protein AmDm5_1882 [Acetobacter malorum]|uniref:Uncharacterized protein n=1 Tax=Acetobacter malorum TaxID=178901 RepID=A0A087PKH7_9PROT|nr:hypothetical protein [Acetobacter malorum]KFL87880.1 hypothetical protein AmDm5_1882 [Acetobacter malorum]OAG75990.1 hypothetical protein Amal_01760 [Acetobacter malorum]